MLADAWADRSSSPLEALVFFQCFESRAFLNPLPAPHSPRVDVDDPGKMVHIEREPVD